MSQEDEDDQELEVVKGYKFDEGPAARELTRNRIGWFFLLGFWNNFTWVALNAGAGDIVPGQYALIYIVNQVPSVVMKLLAPYIFPYLPYSLRAAVCVMLVGLCYPLVYLSPAIFWQLVGVVCVSIQSGIGESSCLALSQAFRNPKDCLAMWSSGTGFAGPGGYLLNLYCLSLLPRDYRVVVGEVVAVLYGLTYFYLLQPPQTHTDHEEGERQQFVSSNPHDLSWLSHASRMTSKAAKRCLFLLQGRGQSDPALTLNPTPQALAGRGGGTRSSKGARRKYEALNSRSDSSSVVMETELCSGGVEQVNPLAMQDGDGDNNNNNNNNSSSSNNSSSNSNNSNEEGHDDESQFSGPSHTTMPSSSGSSMASMDTTERLWFVLGLWPYTVPLFTVYWSEYVLQAGAWTAFAFDPSKLDKSKARDQAYKYMNFMYQVGVFLSRSSGSFVTVNRAVLWSMPVLQCGFLAMFTLDSMHNFWTGWSLLVPAFCVGLLGGGVYVNAFIMINREVPPRDRELALSSTAVADSTGILLADVMALYWQWCLYSANGIADQADGKCPL